MTEKQSDLVNFRAQTEGEMMQCNLSVFRQTEGDVMAVAIANAYIVEALRFIYRVTGPSGANAAVEMFRAEFAKRHPLLDAEAASEALQ